MHVHPSRNEIARDLADDKPHAKRPAAARPTNRRLHRVAAVVTALAVVFLAGRAAPPASAEPAGSVQSIGAAPAPGLLPNAVDGAVGLAPAPDGAGYWVATERGGVFTFGSAPFLGSLGNLTLNNPIVGIAATPSGRGYWLVSSDGGIFTFGDAPFLGSLGAIRLNNPIVGIAATRSGRGYWLASSDGGIFTFGDARFLGSTAGLRVQSPIVGFTRSPSGRGYTMLSIDGGVFTFGDARFFGATSRPDGQMLVSITARPQGDGYWVLSRQPSAAVRAYIFFAMIKAFADTRNPGGMWDRMAACETGGNWAMKGSVFSGGVGFANVTWSRYRDDWMPLNAGDASRELQIIVADRVLWQAAGGVPSRSWGCARRVGLP
ncbi:MAG: transglycosylase family protein [Acidimicrobiia bacterium]